MELDTLQIPATVINNDKLVSMYGSLLAKKKADEDAYQKDLIGQMSKIDAAGIKAEDIADYKKMYDEYVSYGTSNMKNLSDPEAQVKLKQMENQLKGFINLSKANKEEDIKILPFTSPDYDDATRKNALSHISTRTLDRSGRFDLTSTKKVDNKDYISTWKIDPKEIVVKGNSKYTNSEEAYPTILKNIEENVVAKANTPDGLKAISQYAVSAGFDLTTQDGINKAVKGLAKTLFDINKVNFDKAIVLDTPDKVSSEEKSAKLGYDIKKEGIYQARAERLYNLFKGNPKVIASIKQSFPGASITDNEGQFKITIPPYKDRSGNDVPARVFEINRSDGPASFMAEANRLFEILGERKGYKDIDNEELDSFLRSPKNSRFLKSPKKYDYYQKPKNSPPSSIFDPL